MWNLLHTIFHFVIIIFDDLILLQLKFIENNVIMMERVYKMFFLCHKFVQCSLDTKPNKTFENLKVFFKNPRLFLHSGAVQD